MDDLVEVGGDRTEDAFREIQIGHLGYFSSIDFNTNYRNKNQHLIFHPNNMYESWLTHGAIPFAFRSFICNTKYIGRGELALYVKLALTFDQFGICYQTYEELAEGVFSSEKQIAPLISGLIDKHLILRSPSTVKVPWLGKKSSARYIYQRPSAAYTVARMHYCGYPDGMNSRSYLDQESFDACVETLLAAYTSRIGRSSPDKEHDFQIETMRVLSDKKDRKTFKQVLFNSYLRDFEKTRAHPYVGPDGNNVLAIASTAKSKQEPNSGAS